MLLAACSTTKFVPEREYLLEEVKIMSDDSDLDASQLEPYIRQKANSTWFSFLKIPLGAYSLSGKDSTKWINRTLKKLGENLLSMTPCRPSRLVRYLPLRYGAWAI